METEIAEPSVRLGGFEDFYRRWFPPVARSVGLMVQNAELGQDIAQEGFRALWERWDRMASPDHARNFVFRVSLNQARSHLRRRRTHRLLRFERLDDPGRADPSDEPTDRIAVFQALAALSRRQRECLVLVDYLGYDATAAGKVLGIRPSTVRVQLMRGRARLREALGKEG
jgi:RNA polymerase sigma-70 factor (ECF subfamily)